MCTYKPFCLGVSLLALTIVGVTGCATVGQQPAGAKTSPINKSTTTTTSLATTSNSTSVPVASKTKTKPITSNMTITVSSSNHKSQSGSGVHDSSKTPWSSVVVQSMVRVMKNTSAPLVAPTYIGQSNNSNYPYLTSLTTSTSDEYRVAFHITLTQVGVDSPSITQPPNSGLAEYVGEYGATEFSNSKQASGALNQFTIKIPSLAVTESTNLGYGIQGRWFLYANTATLQWYEGKWICQVVGGSKEQELQESKKIVAYLDKHLLPERPGVLLVMQAGDGNHTEIHWAIGHVMFSAGNYHQVLNAIKMAMSMRMYPSGQLKGVQY